MVRMKLGELLVQAGRITQADLEETLKSQAIFGGKFGTNLVEMGFLDEHDLAHFLSKKLGIPHASPEQLMDVPPQITRLIPEEAVRKYQVMPIALNNRKLTVAMADPTDYATIDEISFLTGYIVVPVVTPELRLISALEKHYNIRREMRYIRVEGGGRNRAARLAQSAAPQSPAAQGAPQQRPAQPAAPAASPVAPGAFASGAPASGDRVSVDAALSDLTLSSLNLSAPAKAPAPAEPEEEILELPLLSDFEHFGEPEKPEPLVSHGQPAAAVQQEPARDYSLDGVLLGLTEAQDRHAIAELLVNYAAQRFDRSALFLLKGGTATGWVGMRSKKPLPDFEQLEVPLGEPSVLKVVSDSKSYYLGPMPLTSGNSRIVAAMGGGNPVNNLLVPLVMMGRVVAILYVEGGTMRPDQELPELQRLLGKTSMAFEILILKSKILGA